ncbi:MAG: amino acid permease [Candidatus Tagabacteria bacterium]
MLGKYFKGVGMLVGMIFGAGVFVLPFSIVKAGVFWGVVHFLAAIVLMIFLHFWYGEVAYNTPGKHRFIGYVEKFLGKRAKQLAFLITIFTYYGALLVYGLLGGIFLANFIPLPSFILSLAIFAAGGLLIFLHFKKIAGLNFFLSLALAGLVIFLFFYALPHIQINNFSFNDFFRQISGSNWFLPYGVWLFALAGFSVLPEVRDIACPANGGVSNSSLKNLKRIILVSLLLCAVLYLIFTFTVVGVGGKNTTEDALGGLGNILGPSALLICSLLGFFAVFTSFIALGADLKNIFRYDFRFPNWLAWLGVSAPPIILFLLGLKNFIGILGIIGAIGLGFFGILIILMARRLPNRRNDKRFLFLSWLFGILIIAGILAALIF